MGFPIIPILFFDVFYPLCTDLVTGLHVFGLPRFKIKIRIVQWRLGMLPNGILNLA